MRKSGKLRSVGDMSRDENSNFPFIGRFIFFATGNINKFNEVRNILSKSNISVGMLKLKGDEIQSDSLKEIAQKSVIYAYKRCQLPILVEDAGLFIDLLSGFPGPYAAYIYKTIHNNGILKLMDGSKERHAKFQSVIAYCDHETICEPIFFEGEVNGEITLTERKEQGKSGFGFDPIFQPNGNEKTFAEMTIDEKSSYSHRAMAIRKFAEWYRKRQT
jgi:XTP/dITP diphosphohydrolase